VNAANTLKNIRAVLCGTSHPGNIGAVARALKTMGLSHLFLVNPARFPDPEARWRASRATDVLDRTKVCKSLDEALSGVTFAVACSARSRTIAVPAATVHEAAARLVEIARNQQVAVVFGTEKFGLTTAEVNKCRMIATIPANPRYSSLNLASAVQVFAYELRLAACSAPVGGSPPLMAAHEEVEAFYMHLEQAMIQVGFFDPNHPRKLMPRLRCLFARAQLEHEEINILRGLLKAFCNRRQEP